MSGVSSALELFNSNNKVVLRMDPICNHWSCRLFHPRRYHNQGVEVVVEVRDRNDSHRPTTSSSHQTSCNHPGSSGLRSLVRMLGVDPLVVV
jgi:hypothetical protein